jgi:hypothetical protein
VKLGNYAVIANDHTLVLGWNSAAVPLLRQMAMTKAQYPKPNALQRCGTSTRWFCAHAPQGLLWADVSRKHTAGQLQSCIDVSRCLDIRPLPSCRATIMQSHC